MTEQLTHVHAYMCMCMCAHTHTHTHTHTHPVSLMAYKNEKQSQMRHTEGITCDNISRQWSDAVASQGMPRTDGHHQRLKRGREGFSPLGFRGFQRCCQTLILDCLSLELRDNKFLLFQVIQFVKLYCGNPRKLIQYSMATFFSIKRFFSEYYLEIIQKVIFFIIEGKKFFFVYVCIKFFTLLCA